MASEIKRLQELLCEYLESPETRKTIVSVLVIGALVGGWYGYKYYVTYRATEAQSAFLDCLDESSRAYNLTSKAASNIGVWDDAVLAFESGYDRNKRDDLAPYFLVLQAHALLQQDKKNEAVDVLSKALDAMGTSSVYYNWYRLVLARVYIDLPDRNDEGMSLLRELSKDEKNIYRDSALYFLGDYYWHRGELAQAKQVWQELIELFGKEEQAPSPWVARVQHNLEQIA